MKGTKVKTHQNNLHMRKLQLPLGILHNTILPRPFLIMRPAIRVLVLDPAECQQLQVVGAKGVHFHHRVVAVLDVGKQLLAEREDIRVPGLFLACELVDAVCGEEGDEFLFILGVA